MQIKTLKIFWFPTKLYCLQHSVSPGFLGYLSLLQKWDLKYLHTKSSNKKQNGTGFLF